MEKIKIPSSVDVSFFAKAFSIEQSGVITDEELGKLIACNEALIEYFRSRGDSGIILESLKRNNEYLWSIKRRREQP